MLRKDHTKYYVSTIFAIHLRDVHLHDTSTRTTCRLRQSPRNVPPLCELIEASAHPPLGSRVGIVFISSNQPRGSSSKDDRSSFGGYVFFVPRPLAGQVSSCCDAELSSIVLGCTWEFCRNINIRSNANVSTKYRFLSKGTNIRLMKSTEQSCQILSTVWENSAKMGEDFSIC